ncbi:TPA: hypothetical protein DEP96_02310 [Candidatus Uhrbacteria bacterium]|nr:hypothetical protein [Candidatus Uhrbacteria bacterium]
MNSVIRRQVRHLPFSEARALSPVATVRKTDIVIVPARNEGTKIASTLGYLLIEMGFDPSQILVIVNHSVDDTADRARRLGVVVLDQDEILTPVVVERLQTEYGIDPARLCGKGTAMFAACLELERRQTSANARVFFLDADIKNLAQLDIIGLLMSGWHQWGESVRIVKLASLCRNNEGMLAFLGLPGIPYMQVGAMQWVLCGQMMLRWRDLRIMRGATRYAIEMAMLMDLWERHHDLGALGEVAIGEPLEDKRNTDHDHAVMYRGIMAYVLQLMSSSTNWRAIHKITREEIVVMNAITGNPLGFFAPPSDGVGPSVFENPPLDAILPSAAEFMGS